MACEPQTISSEKYLSKSMVDDEWYVRAVLVDKQSHNSLAFTGMECGVERVKFEVTKDKLLAFRSISRENKNQASAHKHTLIAAFPIVRHVDNKSISAFSSWESRPYIEVDWSKNLVPHLECNGWLQSITHVNLDANSVDPADPYKVRMSEDYIETTLNALVQPEQAACSSIGDPNCVSAKYRVKFSFRKVEKNDYEKRHYPDYEYIKYGRNQSGFCREGEEGCRDIRELWLYSDAHNRISICDPLKDNIADCFAPKLKLNARFGFFRTHTAQYSQKDGFSHEQEEPLINRWNIWLKSTDEEGNPLPLAERVPKKIIYYLNPGFPSSLHTAIENAKNQWNSAFAHVVAQVKNQCNESAVIEAVKKYNLDNYFQHNGISKIDGTTLHKACELLFDRTKNNTSQPFFTGRPDEVLQVYGDLFEIRINDCNVNNVLKYQHQHGLLNILTNNHLSQLNEDTVEQACAILEHEAQERGLPPFFWQRPGDMRFSFVNGITKPEEAGLLGYGPLGVDPQTGEIISGNANIYLATITEYATKSVLLMDKMDRLDRNMMLLEHIKKNTKKDVSDLGNLIDKAKSLTNNHGIFLGTSLKENLSKILPQGLTRNTYIETNSLDTKNEIDSIFSALSGEKDAQISNKNDQIKKHNFYSERNACFSEKNLKMPFKELRNKLENKSFEEKIESIKEQIVESVVIHELGHTLGLRHNFKGAQDALNFPPNFWGIETKDFRNKPGFVESELRSSSVMDYHKYFNSHLFGLGLYDYAALVFGYGEKVEVFDEQDEKFVPTSLLSRLELMHYRDLPLLFSGKNAEATIRNHINDITDKYRRKEKSAYIDIHTLSLESHPENLYKRKYVDYTKIKQNTFAQYFGGKKEIISPVPYSFCTDSQINSSDIFCRPFLYGSSPSEVVSDAIENYERALLMQKMGIDMLPRQVGSYLGMVYGGVYLPFLKAYQHMFAVGNDEISLYPAAHDSLMSTQQGLDLISRTLQRVEPGIYCKNTEGNYVPKQEAKECSDYVHIGGEMGQPFHSSLSGTMIPNTERVGFIYDKILALITLIDGHASFSHEFSSIQAKNLPVGLYRSFMPQIIKIFSSIYTDNWVEIAPTITKDKNGEIKIEYQDLFNKKYANSSLKGRIKPSTSGILKDFAIILSMAGLSNLTDHHLDFAQRSRIQVFGAPAAPEMDNHIENIVFRDPHTGIRYQAFVPDEKDLSVGYVLLKDALDFIDDGTEAGRTAGPWYRAKTQLADIVKEISANNALTMSLLNREDLEKELIVAQKIFGEQNSILQEKIRVIKKVQSLSSKLTDS